jgi:hypothetical protein
MAVTIRNLTRRPIEISLTNDCVTKDLKVTRVRQRKLVRNPRTFRWSTVVHWVDHPPTITLRPMEIREDLPDAVLDAPAVKALRALNHPRYILVKKTAKKKKKDQPGEES